MRPYQTRLLKRLPQMVLLVAIGLMLVALFFAYRWHIAKTLNQAFSDGSIVKRALNNDAPHHAYSVGYRLAQQKQDSATVRQMIRAFTIAEVAEDESLRARAKYAVGNLYFDLSAISGDIAAGGSHQQAVAQIELAREAYKSALRINPQMYDARFNLELLDRLSPDKRTQAWLAETDGVTLQPFKRNGTAMMRDNTRRGLP